jgi:hypothetical protein
MIHVFGAGFCLFPDLICRDYGGKWSKWLLVLLTVAAQLKIKKKGGGGGLGEQILDAHVNQCQLPCVHAVRPVLYQGLGYENANLGTAVQASTDRLLPAGPIHTLPGVTPTLIY